MLRFGLNRLYHSLSSNLVKSQQRNAHSRFPLKWSTSHVTYREDQIPKNTDVLIIGGGIVGWATAFWLRHDSKFSVTVVEKDPTYSQSATVLGLGSIRQQFSEPENIQMSLFSTDFLRNITKYLSVEDLTENIDIDFNPQGCLILADSKNADLLKENYLLQLDLGAKVDLLGKKALSERWPWLSIEDVEMGCYGYENEGWFDPFLLLKALKTKCHFMGVNYVVGEVIEFDLSPYTLSFLQPVGPLRPPVSSRPLRYATVLLPDQSRACIEFNSVVNAAGPWAARVAELAEVGSEYHPLRLPVEPRYRQVFVVRPKNTLNPDENKYPLPGLDMPFMIDHNRLFIERRDLSGEFFVYSDDPKFDFFNNNEQSTVNYEFFHEHIKPLLRKRIPGFKDVEVTSGWISICDYNTWDQNLIIGSHPFHANMYLCNGSSGHGTQHAIAIGKSVSELLTYHCFKTLDLARFSFDRLYINETIKETNCF
ncbi:FAD-dependent oxidoreductase domain-containing protein isoform 3 [Schistosoma japonicum]|uniref:FAD-dependent oxidoreductase domain-containing protein 1 n=1 Tax=Schistosoma japonicum TaxID=6182 RepID=A0A4Z2CRT1_SCHJA|nr:FAD-dependent oxidoreductase domain-containing protein isoform 3 [Schistosoma japonicum]